MKKKSKSFLKKKEKKIYFKGEYQNLSDGDKEYLDEVNLDNIFLKNSFARENTDKLSYKCENNCKVFSKSNKLVKMNSFQCFFFEDKTHLKKEIDKLRLIVI